MTNPKRGRPKQYENPDGKSGAPQLGVRVAPLIYDYIHSQPEGPRSYLERLVQQDMGLKSKWYEPVLQGLEDRLVDSFFSTKGNVSRWAVSAAFLEPNEKTLPHEGLLKICRASSENRTGWPFLYCDQGVSQRSWGLEGFIDHSLGAMRIDGWEIDARGVLHHSATRGSPEQKVTTFRDLLVHPLLALETISELFSRLGSPQQMLYVRVSLRNAMGLRLVHHDGLHQQAGPLQEPILSWEKYITGQELGSGLVDYAADIYEKFRACFGPATQTRSKIKEQLVQILGQRF